MKTPGCVRQNPGPKETMPTRSKAPDEFGHTKGPPESPCRDKRGEEEEDEGGRKRKGEEEDEGEEGARRCRWRKEMKRKGRKKMNREEDEKEEEGERRGRGLEGRI